MNTPTIIKGSILDFEGDCIVNPANNFLDHSGGLARVIAEAATVPYEGPLYGTVAERAERAEHNGRVNAWILDHEHAPLLATGSAYATAAGGLPYRGVIHAVGPVYGGGHFCERTLLASAHSEALRSAEALGYRSIAFPALSCGVFGYPVVEAARIAVAALLFTKLDVSVYLFSDEHVAAYTDAVRAVTA